MTTLTLESLELDIETIIGAPVESGFVRCRLTHSIGKVLTRLGSRIDEHGKVIALVFVKVVKPAAKSHHKKDDLIFWRNPDSCGQ